MVNCLGLKKATAAAEGHGAPSLFKRNKHGHVKYVITNVNSLNSQRFYFKCFLTNGGLIGAQTECKGVWGMPGFMAAIKICDQ